MVVHLFLSLLRDCVSACTREKDRETYVHVEDGWFVLVRKQLSFEICTINLPSHQSANLDTIHSVHSCSFEDRIVRFSRCVQNSIWKYFSPAHLKPTNFKRQKKSWEVANKAPMQKLYFTNPTRIPWRLPSVPQFVMYPQNSFCSISQRRANQSKTPTSNCLEWTP